MMIMERETETEKTMIKPVRKNKQNGYWNSQNKQLFKNLSIKQIKMHLNVKPQIEYKKRDSI